MKVRMKKKAIPTQDAVAMMIEGHLWCWMDAPGLFIRLVIGSIPADYIAPSDEKDAAFIRGASAAETSVPPLPVQRGDSTTIGGVTVDDTLFDMVEKSHGAVAWRTWNGYLVARDNAGETVAIWMLPKDTGLFECFLAEHAGHVWACNKSFIMRISTPAKDLKKMRKTFAGPAVVAALAANLARAEGGVAAPLRRADGVVTVGECRFPAIQLDAIEANCGKDLEWITGGPGQPIGARRGGVMVAVVMPFATKVPS